MAIDDPQSAERRALVERILSLEKPLLYDAEGNPIPRDSDLWGAGQAEYLRVARQALNDVLDTLPSGATPKDLAEHINDLSKNRNYQFDVVDGKLSLPVRVVVGQAEFKAHIPVYRLLMFAAGGLAVYFLHKDTREERLQISDGFTTQVKDLDFSVEACDRSDDAVVCILKVTNWNYIEQRLRLRLLPVLLIDEPGAEDRPLTGTPMDILLRLPPPFRAVIPAPQMVAVTFNSVPITDSEFIRVEIDCVLLAELQLRFSIKFVKSLRVKERI